MDQVRLRQQQLFICLLGTLDEESPTEALLEFIDEVLEEFPWCSLELSWLCGPCSLESVHDIIRQEEIISSTFGLG